MAYRLLVATLIAVSVSCSGCNQSPTLTAARDSEESVPEAWTARGHITTLNGQPAADVAVAKFWSANGQLWDENGRMPQGHEMSENELAEFWSNEGLMEPYPIDRGGGVMLQGGEFTVENNSKDLCVVMALNNSRTHGGIDAITPDSNSTIKIVMKPLVRVFGKIRASGKVPEWTNVNVFYPDGIKAAPD